MKKDWCTSPTRPSLGVGMDRLPVKAQNEVKVKVKSLWSKSEARMDGSIFIKASNGFRSHPLVFHKSESVAPLDNEPFFTKLTNEQMISCLKILRKGNPVSKSSSVIHWILGPFISSYIMVYKRRMERGQAQKRMKGEKLMTCQLP